MKPLILFTLILLSSSVFASSNLGPQHSISNLSWNSIPSEEKIKRIIFLANPFYKFKLVGKDAYISVFALDRYPVTDTSYYEDWTENLTATIHCYLGDSSIDHLVFWIYPQNSNDPAKALMIPYTLNGIPKFRQTTAKERMEVLLGILPFQSHSIVQDDMVILELFGQSVKYMAVISQYFDRYDSFLKYRTTLASVAIDFVFDKTNNPYHLVQVRNNYNGEIKVSETYDIRCGLMEYALNMRL